MNHVYPPLAPTVAHLDFPDYERIIANLPMPPIIANNLETDTKEGFDKVKNLLFTRYQGDTLSSTPKCACGELTSGWNKGLICDICGTECVHVLDKPLESTVWLEVPEGIDRFISPGFYSVLSTMLTKSGFNLVKYLIDPAESDPLPKNPLYNTVQLLGLTKKERNLNFFQLNFEVILRRIVSYTLIKKKPKGIPGMHDHEIKEHMSALYENHLIGPELLVNTNLGIKFSAEKKLAKFVLKYIAQPERAFTKYLPMPAAAGIILESNKSGTWGETPLLVALDALFTITRIKKSHKARSLNFRNARSVAATEKMAEYAKAFIKNTAGSKEGLFRRHICGGRVPFSMRAVISSINAPHHHDEIWLPWTQAVQFFKLDIVNKLSRRGYGPKQAVRIIDNHTENYSPLLDEIFQELIQESGGGIWVTFQRSPSLVKASIQLVKVTKIKNDVPDKTISMSSNITNGPNADKLWSNLMVMSSLI